jgi:hypothetical protein
MWGKAALRVLVALVGWFEQQTLEQMLLAEQEAADAGGEPVVYHVFKGAY